MGMITGCRLSQVSQRQSGSLDNFPDPFAKLPPDQMLAFQTNQMPLVLKDGDNLRCCVHATNR
ncbi:hypothetical protein H261_22968, partial [Paramagnetospirillum caucaseum]